MQTFDVTVKHDNGEAKLRVSAVDMISAVVQVVGVEDCPERAIVKIERVK